MGLRRLALTLAARHVAEAESLLTLAGAIAISCADAGDSPLLEPATGTEPLWPQVRMSALLPTGIDTNGVERLLRPVAPAMLSWEDIGDNEWRAALEQTVKPLRIGRHLMLAPADWSGSSADRTVVRLAMGLAFGTGEHPTTALCLEWLERNPVDETRVLDFGCGSGVLAITALMRGARYAWATDTEPQALTATRRNAELNGVASSIWLGPPSALPAIRADIVVANIVAGTLIESAAWIARHSAPHGVVVLSGILEKQSGDVERAYKEHFDHFAYAARSGWLRVTAKRRKAD